MGQVDERHMFKQAVSVLSGDLNPHFFKYPSLPIYLTAAAMKTSLLLFPIDTNGSEVVFHVPREPGQRYQPSRPMEHARLAFSALSALLFFLVALLGRQLTGSWAPGCLTPLWLCLAPQLQLSAVEYQNVDLPSTLFSLGALASALLGFLPGEKAFHKRSPLLVYGVLPGVLGGCAVACKYNAGVVLASCALAILLSPRAMPRPRVLLTLGLSAALAFFVAVPYSLLDFEHFRADVLYELRHYKNGHPGFDGEPGLPQLHYYLTYIYNAYGTLLSLAALLGVSWGLWKRPRPTMVVLSFPVLMLLHMSTNRVHFLRTVLPVFALLPVFAGVGAFACFDVATQSWSKYANYLPSRFIHAGTSAALVSAFAILTFTHPQAERIFDRNIQADTRDRAAQWLAKHKSNVAVPYVSRDLWMPKEDLPGRSGADFGRHDQERIKEWLSHSSQPAYLLVPHYGVPKSAPVALRRNKAKRAKYLNKAKHLAQSANDDQQRFMEKVGARSVHVIPGRPTALESERDKALSTDDPQIEIYYWPGKGEPDRG
jgi:hypothetical protein